MLCDDCSLCVARCLTFGGCCLLLRVVHCLLCFCLSYVGWWLFVGVCLFAVAHLLLCDKRYLLLILVWCLFCFASCLVVAVVCVVRCGLLRVGRCVMRAVSCLFCALL